MNIWPNIKQFIICLVIGLSTLILGYAADIKFLQKKLYFVREQQIKTRKLLQVKKREMQVSQVEKQKSEIVSKQYAAKIKRFNKNFDVADILGCLEKAAVESHVELQALEPQTIKEDKIFVVYPVRVAVTGEYKSLLMFINAMFKQPYFVVFEELTLQKKENDNGSDALNMQTLIAVYKNNFPIAENATNEPLPPNNSAIKLPESDIFTQAIGKTNLFLWASRELTFLGMMQQGQNVYGFISDPTGEVHRVVVGDKIGLKQSEITAIGEHGITTADVFIGGGK